MIVELTSNPVVEESIAKVKAWQEKIPGDTDHKGKITPELGS